MGITTQPAEGTRVRTLAPLGYWTRTAAPVVAIAPGGVEGVVAHRSPDEPEHTFHVVVDMPGEEHDGAVIPLVDPRQIEVLR